MSSDPSLLTVVIINFRTPDLTSGAVRSLRKFYPDVPLLLIDNGSGAGSRKTLEELRALSPDRTSLILNETNIHHGPAMDQAMHLATTPFVLFIDSDCDVRRGGFIEPMARIAGESPRHYAVGKKIFMNERGFDIAESPHAHPYIRPICMLIRRDRYLQLPPFERHGAPCLANMIAARAAGLVLLHFPVEEYVHHLGRGTAARHGYALGLKGRINHLLNKLGL